MAFSAGAVAEEPRDIAIALLREAAQIPEANVGTSLRLAKAFVEAGDSTTAGPLLVKVWDASLKLNEEEVPVIWLLSDIAKCQAEIGQEDLAIKAARQLSSSYRRAIILSDIATVLAENGKAAAAFQTVDLIPAQERLQESTPGTHRDMALSQLSMAFSERHDYADASKAADLIGVGLTLTDEEKLAAEKSKAMGRFWVFYFQLESGGISAALQTAHSFDKQSSRDSALCRMLRCGGDRIDLATARKILDAIKDQSMKDVGAASLAGRLCRLKQLEEAASLVDKIQDAEEKANGLLELAVGHAANGDMKKTRALLDQSTALAPLASHLKKVATRRIVEAFVTFGHFDQGQEFLREQNDLETRSECFEVLAIARWKQGNKALAQQAILDSRKTAIDIPNAYLRSVRLRELAVALSRINAKEEAVTIVKLALTAGREIESGGGTDVLNLIEIAASQAACCDAESVDSTLEDAYAAARKYPDKTYIDSLIGRVITAQAKYGNSTHAIQISREGKSPEARAGFLVAAAEGLLARSSPTPPDEKNCGNQ